MWCGACIQGFGVESGECLGDVVEKNMMDQVHIIIILLILFIFYTKFQLLLFNRCLNQVCLIDIHAASWGEDHSAAGCGIGGSVIAADSRVQKSVRSGNGLPLFALRHLVSLPVSTPLRIVNRCWSCSCKWRYNL